MRYLVVVADDYGLCASINEGCLEAYQNGIVTELSLMMGWPGTEGAISLAKENNIDHVGIHLTLNNYNQSKEYLRTADYKEILAEESTEKLQAMVKSELDQFEKLMGRAPSHITSHQHTHLHPKLANTVANYAAKHSIYVRQATDYFFGHIRGSYAEVSKKLLIELGTVTDNSVTEIMFHPGLIDEFLQENSTMLEERKRDLKLAKDEEFKDKVQAMGFKIVSFNEINSNLLDQ